MKKIKKYLLFAFLIENIAALTSLFGGFSDLFFYVFLFLGALLVFSKEILSLDSFKTFGWAYLLSIVFIVYCFFVGIEYINQRSLLYLIAKLTTFIIIIVGVKTNYRFYSEKAPYYLCLIMCFFIIYGVLTNTGMGGDRMRLGYGNVNITSWMGALSVGCILFLNKKWNFTNISIVVIGIFGMLAGASRAAFLLIAFIILVRYGLKPKLVVSLLLVYSISVFLLPSIGLNTIGLTRLQNTVNGVENVNRDQERLATLIMIKERPLMGWGFEASNVGVAAQISELGSHSGYLDTIKFMGYPMGCLWLAIVVITTLYLAILVYKRKRKTTLYLAYALALLLVANYESYFVGVHEYATNFFFFSIAMMSASLNNKYGNTNKNSFLFCRTESSSSKCC